MLAALALACGPRGSAAPQPLRLALETEFHSLDPADASSSVSRRLTSQIYDTLVDWDPREVDLPRLVPELLVDLPEIGAGGLTYTMRLRTGADAPRFAADACLGGQARAVRASDVAASLLRLDPARHANAALLAGRVAGLDAWQRAREGPPPIVADDAAATVTLTLTRPQPEFAAILANPGLAIVPPECVAYYDGRDAEHPPFARHPVGSGPYRLDHAASVFPHTAVLVESPDRGARPYPQPPGEPLPCATLPGAPRVVLSHFQHDEPALRAFQAGELAALVPGQAQFAEVVRDGRPVAEALPPGTGLTRFPVASVDMLVFRMGDPEIGEHPDPARARENRALRRAIARAIDVPRYLAVVRNGAWAEAHDGVVPRGVPGAPPAAAVAGPDLEGARAMLAEAGLSGRTWALRYWTGTSEAEQQEAALLRESLRPIGVDLQITRREDYLAAIFDPRRPADAQLFGLRFDADYLDAANFLAPFTCGAADNFSGYCDPGFDAAFAAFAGMPPGPGRERAAIDLQARLADGMPARPIDQPSAWILHQPWLGGLVRHPIAGLRVELLCPRGRGA